MAHLIIGDLPSFTPDFLRRDTDCFLWIFEVSLRCIHKCKEGIRIRFVHPKYQGSDSLGFWAILWFSCVPHNRRLVPQLKKNFLPVHALTQFKSSRQGCNKDHRRWRYLKKLESLRWSIENIQVELLIVYSEYGRVRESVVFSKVVFLMPFGSFMVVVSCSRVCK